MILEAALALKLSIATINGISPSPFAPGMKVSWESYGNININKLYDPSTDPKLLNSPHRGTWTNGIPTITYPDNPSPTMESFTLNDSIEQDQNQSLAPNPPMVLGCNDCFMPIVSMDWTSIYRIYYGIQVEGMADWSWQSGDSWHEALNFIKSAFQQIHAAELRDVGVDFKISQINFVDETLAIKNNQPAQDHTRQIWTTLNPAHPPQGILRLIFYPGGEMGGTLCSALPGIGQGQLNFNTDMNNLSNSWNSRNYNFKTIIHEMGHAFFFMEHIGCYFIDGTSSYPVELCSAGGCWENNNSICGLESMSSYMSYCQTCWLPDYPNLRIGPMFATVAQIARNNILASSCLGQPVASFPPNWYATDTDKDEIPDVMDNCSKVPNNAQSDSKMNNIGDACRGCEIAAPRTPFWQFLIAPLILLWRKLKTHEQP